MPPLWSLRGYIALPTRVVYSARNRKYNAWLTRGGLTMARVGYSAPRRHACECDDEHGCVVLHSCIRLARTIRRNFHDFRYILKHHWPFYPRDALARALAMAWCLCLSVGLSVSVTSQSSIKTDGRLFGMETSFDLSYSVLTEFR